jgi:hypothetical protein
MEDRTLCHKRGSVFMRQLAMAPAIGKYYANIQSMKLKCLKKIMGTNALFAVQNLLNMMICKSITKGYINRVKNE